MAKSEENCAITQAQSSPLAQRQDKWIVVFATGRGLWVDGKAVGTLTNGRIPMLGGNQGQPGCPRLTKKRLDQAFKQALSRRDPSLWKMKLNISYEVSDDLVQTVLTRAGRLNVAKVVVHRFMEHP